MIKDVSKQDSKYVVSFALTKEEQYMRYSLEQFLIGELNPPLTQLLRFILVFLANQRFVFLICFTVFYKF